MTKSDQLKLTNIYLANEQKTLLREDFWQLAENADMSEKGYQSVINRQIEFLERKRFDLVCSLKKGDHIMLDGHIRTVDYVKGSYDGHENIGLYLNDDTRKGVIFEWEFDKIDAIL